MSDDAFWFNTRTHQVEQTDNKSQSKDLLGPYPTQQEAEHALQTAQQRTEQWDAEDREWEEGR